jgi:hypothetical protein
MAPAHYAALDARSQRDRAGEARQALFAGTKPSSEVLIYDAGPKGRTQ